MAQFFLKNMPDVTSCVQFPEVYFGRMILAHVGIF